MNKFEAEKIVKEYGGCIAMGAVKRASWLPYSKAKIKQAYFDLIEAIFKDFGQLSEDMGNKLVLTYSMLNHFVPDNVADELDEVWEKMHDHKIENNNEADGELVKKWLVYAQTMRDGELHDEINDFIGDCQKLEKKGSS
jgi:hypothetical protein